MFSFYNSFSISALPKTFTFLFGTMEIGFLAFSTKRNPTNFSDLAIDFNLSVPGNARRAGHGDYFWVFAGA